MAVESRYGDARSFLETFNPSLQAACAAHPAHCYFGKAPCLSAVARAYGYTVCASWLETQIRDLANYAGARDKLTATQSQQTAAAIMTGFPHLNVAEVMLFLSRFKAGKYGKFYGAVDPLAITSALQAFCKQRVSEITAIEMERERIEAARPREGCVSREEYERIKARAEAGDMEAVRMLVPPQARKGQN